MTASSPPVFLATLKGIPTSLGDLADKWFALYELEQNYGLGKHTVESLLAALVADLTAIRAAHDDELLTPKQAAAYAGCSTEALRQRAAAGRLPCYSAAGTSTDADRGRGTRYRRGDLRPAHAAARSTAYHAGVAYPGRLDRRASSVGPLTEVVAPLAFLSPALRQDAAAVEREAVTPTPGSTYDPAADARDIRATLRVRGW